MMRLTKIFKAVITDGSPQDPRRPKIIDDLTEVLSFIYDQTGRIEDWDEAIPYRRGAFLAHPPGDEKRARTLAPFSGALVERFRHSGGQAMADIDEAIIHCREALELYPSANLGRLSALTDLADALNARFESFGGIELLDEAAALLREALILRPAPTDKIEVAWKIQRVPLRILARRRLLSRNILDT